MEIMDTNGIISQILSVWDGFNSLTGLAVIVAIFTTTVAKEYMASKDKSLPIYAIRVGSFLISIILFVLIGWWAKEELRDKSFVFNAVGSGVAGPTIVWAFKKYLGVDLDEIMAGEKPPKEGEKDGTC